MTSREALEAIIRGESLSRPTMAHLIGDVMDSKLSDPLLAAILAALSAKGESVEEIAGAIDAMRARERPFPAPALEAVDVCGTGGDRSGSVNLSTAVAFVLAGCGVRVIKHGNRAVSSLAGSADVLESLGIRIESTPDEAAAVFREIGCVFLFAPLYHPALKAAGPVRRELGIRTLFNLLGPLANPARVTRQVVGVYDRALLDTIVEVRVQTGGQEILALFGDGLDEVNLSSVTTMLHYSHGARVRREVRAPDFGLPHSPLSSIAGGDRHVNARKIEAVLSGDHTPLRDWVLAGAAPALLVSGHAGSLEEGVFQARLSIDSGAAHRVLSRWRELSA